MNGLMTKVLTLAKLKPFFPLGFTWIGCPSNVKSPNN
jgi:hypothetical protein